MEKKQRLAHRAPKLVRLLIWIGAKLGVPSSWPVPIDITFDRVRSRLFSAMTFTVLLLHGVAAFFVLNSYLSLPLFKELVSAFCVIAFAYLALLLVLTVNNPFAERRGVRLLWPVLFLAIQLFIVGLILYLIFEINQVIVRGVLLAALTMELAIAVALGFATMQVLFATRFAVDKFFAQSHQVTLALLRGRNVNYDLSRNGDSFEEDQAAQIAEQQGSDPAVLKNTEGAERASLFRRPISERAGAIFARLQASSRKLFSKVVKMALNLHIPRKLRRLIHAEAQPAASARLPVIVLISCFVSLFVLLVLYVSTLSVGLTFSDYIDGINRRLDRVRLRLEDFRQALLNNDDVIDTASVTSALSRLQSSSARLRAATAQIADSGARSVVDASLPSLTRATGLLSQQQVLISNLVRLLTTAFNTDLTVDEFQVSDAGVGGRSLSRIVSDFISILTRFGDVADTLATNFKWSLGIGASIAFLVTLFATVNTALSYRRRLREIQHGGSTRVPGWTSVEPSRSADFLGIQLSTTIFAFVWSLLVAFIAAQILLSPIFWRFVYDLRFIVIQLLVSNFLKKSLAKAIDRVSSDKFGQAPSI
ncbi:MAG: hypothetical protein MHM6MM_005403 [Cercozoa sp. M6MM]